MQKDNVNPQRVPGPVQLRKYDGSPRWLKIFQYPGSQICVLTNQSSSWWSGENGFHYPPRTIPVQSNVIWGYKINAPVVFQRLISRILAGIQTESANNFVSVYLNGVIVFSKSLNDHMKAVFNQLRKAGLTLNVSKCKLLCSEVHRCRHRLACISYGM